MAPWRDDITVHPAADLFPPMADAELRDQAADIKANGLHEKVKFIRTPLMLLDGRNRLDAMELAGLPIFLRGTTDLNPDIIEFVPDETDPVAYVIGVNIRRRHLTGEQKRDLIGKLLKLDPSKSNRQVAAIVGVSHHTVGSVRDDAEGCGQIAHTDKRVDTRGRQQPASKPKPESESEPATGTTSFAEMGKVRKITKIAQARLDGLAGMFGGLVTFFEMTKPGMSSDPGIQKVAAKTLALFVQQMVDSPETRDGIKALRNELNRLLDLSKAGKQHADAPEVKQDGEMPDIPACLDRRPTSIAAKAEAN